MEYVYINTPQDFERLLDDFASSETKSLAVDFEEESNLHRYGEHLCTIQLFDKSTYWLVDAWLLSKTEEGRAAIGRFVTGDIEKIIFDCNGDSAIILKSLGFQIRNVYDLRIPAKALGFMGNLTGLIQRNLGIDSEDPSEKQRYQRTDWTRRPLSPGQIRYALSDVTYLFDLKQSLEAELLTKTKGFQKQVAYAMKSAGIRKNPEKPGWEKICNFQRLSDEEKIYIRHFFIARDNLARKADVPASNILEKQLIVAMAKAGTWKDILTGSKLRYEEHFEKARLDAEMEIISK